MTILTTSRRPSQELRTFARDLAFALGCEHINRGKTGLRDLWTLDPVILFIEKQQEEIVIRIQEDELVAGEIRLSGCSVKTREGKIRKGVFVSDQSVYDLVNRYVPVTMVEGLQDGITFDGRQRRLYRCELQT
ncbi:MAG: hypothetical protein D5R96_06685 [Methanocalculus sp. MSAO_Arc2]|uniref:hypothetical protein n=1 Tax=Methanocalculus sp. MSAO_Arc2 TaxID=2293855 RepID=UPI000FF411C9|nr:MAG: hypothetical protein D5R96_06685 [Methanocalculus sp. MSAO_Arc2]